MSQKKKAADLQSKKKSPSPHARDSKRYDRADVAMTPFERKVVSAWTPAKSLLCLVVLTIICLAPFSGMAFHIDDPLFVWTAKQIARHWLDPYGFQVVWYQDAMPMSNVTQNPPLAAYYAALVGPWTGWSERALHFAFLLPALAVVLGVYVLAREFTKMPLLAAAITLTAPGFLVSANSIMCDVPMLALWIWGTILWRRGLNSNRPASLAAGAFLAGVGALTKYFGAALIPLLFCYSAWKRKKIGTWAFYLVIPIALLLVYELWTRSLYGRGLFMAAAVYASTSQAKHLVPNPAALLTGLSFLGGCALPALICQLLACKKKTLIWASALALLSALAVVSGGIKLVSFPETQAWFLAFQLAVFILGGILALAQGISDFRNRRDAESGLLLGWMAGTFVFAAFLNWTVNARSILPLIPAVAVITARGLDAALNQRRRQMATRLVLPVVLSAALGMWVAWGDAALGNSARQAATEIYRKIEGQPGKIFFSGHWGFQYYMESLGAQAYELSKTHPAPGDLVALPMNNTNVIAFREEYIASSDFVRLSQPQWVITSLATRGAGFYSSIWGPLPYAFGPVPDELYRLIRLR